MFFFAIPLYVPFLLKKKTAKKKKSSILSDSTPLILQSRTLKTAKKKTSSFFFFLAGKIAWAFQNQRRSKERLYFDELGRLELEERNDSRYPWNTRDLHWSCLENLTVCFRCCLHFLHGLFRCVLQLHCFLVKTPLFSLGIELLL